MREVRIGDCGGRGDGCDGYGGVVEERGWRVLLRGPATLLDIITSRRWDVIG